MSGSAPALRRRSSARADVVIQGTGAGCSSHPGVRRRNSSCDYETPIDETQRRCTHRSDRQSAPRLDEFVHLQNRNQRSYREEEPEMLTVSFR
jgi:hypothetical protein